MTQIIGYIEALGEHFPNVQAGVSGVNGLDYDSITWLGGEPLPSKEQLDQARLSMARDRMWQRIQAERDRRKAGGVKVGAHWFHSDDTSRIQQLALVIFGQNLPENIMWKTMAGDFVEMTPTLIQQIFQASAAQDMSIFQVAEYHKEQMLASQTPELYDFSQGWPNTMYKGPHAQ